MNPYFLKAENCMFGGKGFRYPLQLAVTLMSWKMSLGQGQAMLLGGQSTVSVERSSENRAQGWSKERVGWD